MDEDPTDSIRGFHKGGDRRCRWATKQRIQHV